MDKLGQMIYRNDFGYEMYAALLRDRATTRISAEIYIVSPEGEMSDLITIQKGDVYTKKKWADVFLGLEADYSRDDIDSIKLKIMNIMKKTPDTNFQSKETLKDMHRILSSYIRENAGHSYEKGGESLLGIFRKGDYGYIDSCMLDEFIKEHKHIGYKRLDILKRLKIMGALAGANGRKDILVSINGKKRHFYKVLLAEEPQKTEEYEMYGNPFKKTEVAGQNESI